MVADLATLPKPVSFIETNGALQWHCCVQRDDRAMSAAQVFLCRLQKLLCDARSLLLRQDRHATNVPMVRLDLVARDRASHAAIVCHCNEYRH